MNINHKAALLPCMATIALGLWENESTRVPIRPISSRGYGWGSWGKQPKARTKNSLGKEMLFLCVTHSADLFARHWGCLLWGTLFAFARGSKIGT